MNSEKILKIFKPIRLEIETSRIYIIGVISNIVYY